MSEQKNAARQIAIPLGAFHALVAQAARRGGTQLVSSDKVGVRLAVLLREPESQRGRGSSQ